jgi:hypothetical protein
MGGKRDSVRKSESGGWGCEEPRNGGRRGHWLWLWTGFNSLLLYLDSVMVLALLGLRGE